MSAQQVQVSVDADVYDMLLQLMVPPLNDANAVIRELLVHEGHASRAAASLAAAETHYSMADEMRRAQAGIYDSACP